MNDLAYEVPKKLVDPIWRAVLLEMLRVQPDEVLAEAGLLRVQWIPTSQCTPSERRPVMVDGGPAYWEFRDGGRWVSMVESPHRVIQWEATRWAELPVAPCPLGQCSRGGEAEP
jgi:hypothetical protein